MPTEEELEHRILEQRVEACELLLERRRELPAHAARLKELTSAPRTKAEAVRPKTTGEKSRKAKAPSFGGGGTARNGACRATKGTRKSAA